MRTRFVIATLAGAALLFAACSDDDATPDTTDAGTDSPSSIPPADAATTDASDGGVDAPVDAAPRTCSDAGFCHATLPGPEILRGVWGDGAGTVWAVSDTGDILRFDGTAWTVFASNPTDSYLAIWGTSPTDIWIGGTNGLRHGTGASSGALVFTAVTTPGDDTVPINAIWGLSATDIWAVGGANSSGRIVHLLNGTWVAADIKDVTDVAWTSVWGSAGAGVFIGGYSGFGITSAALYRKTPTGTAFTELTPDLPEDSIGEITTRPMRIDVGLSTANLSVLVLGAQTTGGGLGRKNIDDGWRGAIGADAGVTWTLDPATPLPSTLPPTAFTEIPLTAGWVHSPTDIWAVGLYGRFRHWDGTTWTQASITLDAIPETTDLYGIWGSPAGELWAVGDNLVIHKAP